MTQANEPLIVKAGSLILDLISVVDEMNRQLDVIHAVPVEEHIRYGADVKSLHKALDDLEKRASALKEKVVKESIPQRYEAAKVATLTAETFDIFSGATAYYRVGVSTKTHASIRADRKPEAFEWLRNNGLSNIIQEQVHPSTLSATAKHLIEEENRELPEEIFHVFNQESASFTKVATPSAAKSRRKKVPA